MKQIAVILSIILSVGLLFSAPHPTKSQPDKNKSVTTTGDNQFKTVIVCLQSWQNTDRIKKHRIKNLNQKVLQIPAPEYPQAAREQKITGTVLVEVLIDIQEGKIIKGQMKSGHPLLQAAVAKVLCKVKFPSTQYDGELVLGLGELKYDFPRP